MTENEFLEACKKYVPRITKYAWRTSGDKDIAADLVQDTITLAWKKLSQYDPTRSSFGTWFTTIYHNVAHRYYRDQYESGRGENTISIDDLLYRDNGEDFSKQAELPCYEPTYDERIALEQALVTMGGIHEKIIRMCFIGGMTFNEVSNELQLVPRKVRRIVATALKKLKRILIQTEVSRGEDKSPSNED